MFAVICIFGALVVAPSVASALTVTGTFPADKAGMAAYVKLDPLTETNFDNAKASLFDSVESFGETYMIGLKEYSVDGPNYNKLNFRIYLGTNGWLVVYLLKDQEPSRIVNWRRDAATGKFVSLSDTLLKFAIENAISKIGAPAVTSVEYYNFAYPDAKKMTLTRENIYNGEPITDDFTVLVPGTLYLASYALASIGGAQNTWSEAVGAYIDNKKINGIGDIPFIYGNYLAADFTAGVSHTIRLDKRNDDYPASIVTMLFYSVN